MTNITHIHDDDDNDGDDNNDDNEDDGRETVVLPWLQDLCRSKWSVEPDGLVVQ